MPKGNEAPITETPAKVLAKTIKVTGGVVYGHGSSSTEYYMSFELPNKNRTYFRVGLAAYITLLEGEIGTLRYSTSDSGETKFEGFLLV